jgi:hypothetical protein
VTVIFIVPVAKVEPSSIPDGDNLHAKVKVALGHCIKSNCINDSPFNRGLADKEL